jgi:hypothetical protein
VFGAEILDVAIGVVFVFLLVSVICSAVREGLEAWLKTRAAYLEHGIRELLHDRRGKGLAKSFYEHPLIYSLYSRDYTPGRNGTKPALLARGGELPSYIPASNFARALMDIAARGPNADVGTNAHAPLLSLENMRNNVANIGNERVQRALLTAIDSAQGDLSRAQKNLEDWYDSAMDRVSGWYKRSTQWVLFGIGLFVAIVLNVNTITIAEYLYRDDTAREALVARIKADSVKKDYSYAEAMKQIEGLNLPILWPAKWGLPGSPKAEKPKVQRQVPVMTAQKASGASPAERGLWDFLFEKKFWGYAFASVPGWLLTALAATMGAPVWFDLLNKMMVIRSTVKPKEKSQEEGSEDRQNDRAQSVAGAPPSTPPAAAAPARPAIPGPPTLTVEDGCDLPKSSYTRDEDLPAAEGGVA